MKSKLINPILAIAVVLAMGLVPVMVPGQVALGYPPANPVRALPDPVEKGGTFNVTVNFTAPGDDFNSISVIDFAPAGWNVTLNKAWCQPPATNVKATGNMAEVAFQQIYDNGTNFTALYKVTVPCSAGLGDYTFDEGNISSLAYYIGNSSHLWENITGDSNVTVVPPAICSQMSIDFYAIYNGTTPPNQTLKVSSSTPCMLNWSLSDDADYNGTDWLSESRENGSCTDVYNPVNLSVNISGMPLGNYTANITIESPEANNSPRIVPVALHITLPSVLEGQVNFTGRGGYGPKWIEPFVVKFYDGASEVRTDNVTTNSSGYFTIIGIIPDTYNIRIKGLTSLSVLVTNVTLSAGMTTVVNFGMMREGDCNQDDWITSADRNLLYTGWGSKVGDDNWNPNCDSNRDGWLTLLDRSLLYTYWGQHGGLACGGEQPSGDGWGFAIQPGVSGVGLGENFTVNITAVHYSGDADCWAMYLLFNTTYLDVTGIDTPGTLPNGETPDLAPGMPAWDNTTGLAQHGYGVQPGYTNYINETFVYCTIHFRAKSANGTSYVNFTTVDPAHATESIFMGTDVLNWSYLVNGTVEIGTTLEGNATFLRKEVAPDPTWQTGLVGRGFVGGNKTWERNVTTNDTGVFNLTGLISGTYDIGIKNWTTLSRLVTNVTLSAGMTTVVDFGPTREGDVNNDDYVDFSDYGILSDAWLSYPGHPNWDARADFNRDDYIDFSDYGPLSANWLQWGDCFGWPGSW